MRRKIAGWGVAVGAAVYLIVFQKELFIGGRIDFTADAIRFYYPSWIIGKQMLLDGGFFLWDTMRCMGQPFAAAPSNQGFYPLRFLSPFVAYLTYQKISVLFHIVLAGSFGFLLAHEYFDDWACGLFGALGMGFNGFFMARIGYQADFAAIAWAPCAIYFLWKRRPFLLAVALGLQWLAGFPPISILTILFLGLFSICERDRTTLIKGFLLMMGLAAFQILPFLEMLKESGRALFLDPQAAVKHSIAPASFLGNLFVPAAFFKGFSQGTALLEDFYIGPVFLLCFIGGAAKAYSKSKNWFWLGMGAVPFLVLSLGKNLPGYSFIPGITLFRSPANWAYPFLLAAILVACYGLRAIRSWQLKGFIILFAAVDLGAHYYALPHLQVKEDFFSEAKVRLTGLQASVTPHRIFHIGQIVNNSPEWSGIAQDWDMLKGILTPSYGTAFGFKEAASHHNLVSQRNLDYIGRMTSQGKASPLFDYAGIKTIVTLTQEGAVKPLPSADDFGIITNPDPKPRAFFHMQGSVDEILKDVPGEIVVKATGPGTLVVSESYYPGWKVRVDKEKGKVQMFEGYFLSAMVPAGVHSVRFVYSPLSVRIGFLISFLTLLGMGVRR